MPEDRSTSSLPLVLQGPTALVLSLSQDVFNRVAQTLELRGFAAAETSLDTVRQDLNTHRPLVLFLDAAFYDFDPHAFDAITNDTNTKLAIVHQVSDTKTLLQRLLNPTNPSGLYGVAQDPSVAALLEADTAKYTKETVREQVELMKKFGEADTVKLDRKAMRQKLQQLREQAATEAVKSDKPSKTEATDDT